MPGDCAFGHVQIVLFLDFTSLLCILEVHKSFKAKNQVSTMYLLYISGVPKISVPACSIYGTAAFKTLSNIVRTVKKQSQEITKESLIVYYLKVHTFRASLEFGTEVVLGKTADQLRCIIVCYIQQTLLVRSSIHHVLNRLLGTLYSPLLILINIRSELFAVCKARF